MRKEVNLPTLALGLERLFSTPDRTPYVSYLLVKSGELSIDFRKATMKLKPPRKHVRFLVKLDGVPHSSLLCTKLGELRQSVHLPAAIVVQSCVV